MRRLLLRKTCLLLVHPSRVHERLDSVPQSLTLDQMFITTSEVAVFTFTLLRFWRRKAGFRICET